MLKLLSIIFVVGVLSLVQSFGFSFLGVKPDLALSVVIAASFFVEGLTEGLFLVALSALILKFSPTFGKEIPLFFSIGAVAVILRRYLPWRPSVSNLILIAVGTLTFYLVMAFNLIFSMIFLKEIILNLIFGALIFALLGFLWQNKKT